VLPKSHPLIEAAVKPLADNAEQQLAATVMLEETFDAGATSIPEDLARLDKADRKRFPRLWRVCLHICAALAFLLLAFPSLQLRNGLRDLRSLSSFGYHEESKVFVPPNLTPDQSLLLGDSNLPELRQKELLHLSAPERPDFYTEYAGKYASTYHGLPDGYLETVARIDPGNSFHLYNAAARQGGDSFEKVKSPKARPPRYAGGKRVREIPDEVVWKINDEAKFNGALELIAKAAALQRYDTYEGSLAASRLPLFNQERMIPRIRTLAYFAGQTSQVISIRKTADLISAKAYFLSLAGDKEGFLKLYADTEAFLAHLSRAPDSHLVAELVFAVNAAGTATAFHFGAERLGLPELAGEMQLRRKALIDDANMRDRREDPMSDHFENKGSALTGLIAPMLSTQVANPPLLDPDSLTPGRLAEHDICSAVLLPAVVTILGLAALAAFVSGSLLPRPVKVLSQRLDLLLRPADWAWVAGAVVVPIGFTLIITRYTALGGRDFNIRHNQMLFPAAHYLLIILLLLTAPPAVIRWRLGKRLGAFGIRSGLRLFLVILPVVGGLALLMAHPLLEHFAVWSESRAMLPLALLPASWGASILIGFGGIYFGKKERRIIGSTALKCLPTALSFAIILLAALVPVFRGSADRWIARDNFTRVVPNGLNSYEAEIASRKRKEINAILER
jgi:hypothetical protein